MLRVSVQFDFVFSTLIAFNTWFCLAICISSCISRESRRLKTNATEGRLAYVSFVIQRLDTSSCKRWRIQESWIGHGLGSRCPSQTTCLRVNHRKSYNHTGLCQFYKGTFRYLSLVTSISMALCNRQQLYGNTANIIVSLCKTNWNSQACAPAWPVPSRFSRGLWFGNFSQGFCHQNGDRMR